MPFDIQGKEIIDDASFNTDDLIKIVDADRQKIRSLMGKASSLRRGQDKRRCCCRDNR